MQRVVGDKTKTFFQQIMTDVYNVHSSNSYHAVHEWKKDEEDQTITKNVLVQSNSELRDG